jgi:hypothetical protein
MDKNALHVPQARRGALGVLLGMLGMTVCLALQELVSRRACACGSACLAGYGTGRDPGLSRIQMEDGEKDVEWQGAAAQAGLRPPRAAGLRLRVFGRPR